MTYVTVSLIATCRMSGKQCSAYGVASDRVYICTQLPAVPVSFYLAFPSVPAEANFCLGRLFLLHFPGSFLRRTLSVILPCDARTFLIPIPFGNMARDSPTRFPYYTRNRLFCQDSSPNERRRTLTKKRNPYIIGTKSIYQI